MAKGFFKSREIEYSEVDVSKNQSALEEMLAVTGKMTVPVIDVNGEFVVGFDRSRIEELLGLNIEKG